MCSELSTCVTLVFFIQRKIRSRLCTRSSLNQLPIEPGKKKGWEWGEKGKKKPISKVGHILRELGQKLNNFRFDVL